MRPRAAHLRDESSRAWWTNQWLQRLGAQAHATRLQQAQRMVRADLVSIPFLGPDNINGRVAVQPPRTCSISLARLGPEAVDHLAAHIKANPALAYQIINRQLPQEIDAALRSQGHSLVPDPTEYIDARCDCNAPDPPCTHAAAVYIAAGLRFDHNPTLLLAARGVTEDQLRAMADRAARSVADWETTEAKVPAELPQEPGGHAAVHLFWGDNTTADVLEVPITPARDPLLNAEAIQRLGKFPGWQSKTPFDQSIETIYRNSHQVVLSIIRETRPPYPD